MSSPFSIKLSWPIFIIIGLMVWNHGYQRTSYQPNVPIACPPSVQLLIDSTAEGGTLNLPACTFTESLVISKNITIIGDISGNTIIQAPANQRVILMNGNKSVNLQYLVISGGNPGNEGGGVYVQDGSLQIMNSTVRNNIGTYGGGIFLGSNALTASITNSLFENNQATYQGGGIYANNDVVLTNTNFNSNTAGTHGGGISNWAGNTSITGGSYSDNHATGGNGGAVNVNNGLVVHDVLFDGNSANDSGGAITQWNAGFSISISDSTFHANTAVNKGGGVFVNSILNLDHDTFDANIVNTGSSANAYGGGVFAGNSGSVNQVAALVVQYSTFTGNKAQCISCPFSTGGGIYSESASSPNPLPTVNISHTAFNANQAWTGGGLDALSNSLSVDHSTFINNTGGYGGGIAAYQVMGEALLFKGNQVVNAGGGLRGYDVTLRQSIFLDNSAGSAGGAALTVTHSAYLANILIAQPTGNNYGTVRFYLNSSGEIVNLTITQPTKGSGTAFYFETGSNFKISNSVITNYAKGMDVFGTVNYDHDLFYNNTTDVSVETGGTSTDHGSNLYQNPLFVNPALANYHLRDTSPAIAGGIYTAGIDVDLDYLPRIPGRSAMGAYNFWPIVYLPLVRK